jgi:hypothetical protein
LRILLTNHGLRERAGTELATFELALALRGMGNEVGIFSPFLGSFAFKEALKNRIPIFSLGDKAELQKFAPDAVHLQHWPNHILLDEMGIRAPRLFHFHGVWAPLESPPHILGISPPWLAVSDKTFRSVSEESLWDSGSGSRIEKWGNFEPHELVQDDKSDTQVKLARVLVVSNHFPNHYADLIRLAGHELGFSLTFVGSGYKVRPVTKELILSFDAVVSLGRTAIQAATLGKPVLLMDYLGLDGWITPDKYLDFESVGFSGSFLKDKNFSYERLLQTLKTLPTPRELADLALIFRQNHSLTAVATKIEKHLELASREQQDFTFERSAFVAAMYIRELWLAENRSNPLKTSLQKAVKRRLIGNFHKSSPISK